MQNYALQGFDNKLRSRPDHIDLMVRGYSAQQGLCYVRSILVRVEVF